MFVYASAAAGVAPQTYAMPRERRQAVQSNAAMYVGYADDDEDVDSIMKKFKALEEAKKKSGGGDELDPDALVEAVGLRVGCGVDYSMDGDKNQACGSSRTQRGPKGSEVQTGEVVIVPGHVKPEELDASDADESFRRLKAGDGYLPKAQRNEEQRQLPSLVPLELEKDVVMVELEGISARTREVLFESLNTTGVDDAIKNQFLDAVTRAMRLLASKKVSLQDRGLKQAVAEAATSVDKALLESYKKCAQIITKTLASDKKNQLASKGKGVGLICVRPGGIPKGSYLGAYCGEVYPGWRWFEKETAAQQVRRDVRRDDEVPVFYNAVVERSTDDPRGYDALFIDGMVKGSILTRASHSCAPNAQMRIRVRDGSYAVEMVTVRDVNVGDEICWDYRCATDSEMEMKRAICLCGSRVCRVSYLHYTSDSTLTDPYLNKKGSVAHFTGELLRACGPCSEGREGDGNSKDTQDKSAAAAEAVIATRAAQAGIKIGTRDAPGVLFGLPPWLVRYAASCVSFIQNERKALEVQLTKTFTDEAMKEVKDATTEVTTTENKMDATSETDTRQAEKRLLDAAADAKAEAEGVASCRLQSLVVTLDKVRHVLSTTHGGGGEVATAPPPLVALDDAATAAHLDATRRRVEDAVRGLGVTLTDDVSKATNPPGISKDHVELVDARHKLASLAQSLRRAADGEDSKTNIENETSCALKACADLCDLVSVTKTFFKPNCVLPFDSPFVQVGAYGGDSGVVRRCSYGPFSVWGFLVKWHFEYCEKSELRLDLETRGVVRPPRPDSVLRKNLTTGSNNAQPSTSNQSMKSSVSSIPAPKGPVGAQDDSFLLNCLMLENGGGTWPDVRGWEWPKLDDVAALFGKNNSKSEPSKVRGSDGVFGSPTFDDVLCGEGVILPGADASTMLTARRAAHMGEQSDRKRSEDATILSPALVPAWNGDDGSVAFDSSRGVTRVTVCTYDVEMMGVTTDANLTDDRVVAMERTMADVQQTLGVRSENLDAGLTRNKQTPSEHPPTPAYGSSFDEDVPCLGCGCVGVDGAFLLCNGCPAGGHLDCLGLQTAPPGRWECDACEGGRLAGIRPPGRLGFEAAAVAAAALGKIGGTGAGAAGAGAAGGVAGLSIVPGAVAPVPSVGPLAQHHLAAAVVVDFALGAPTPATEVPAAGSTPAADGDAGALTKSAVNKRTARDAFLDESHGGGGGGGGAANKDNANSLGGFGIKSPNSKKRLFLKTLTANDASFPTPTTCQVTVPVECGGALGEFRVLEGLVHCFCRGCQSACEVGLQPTNVFGLQAFEFHGGKGSAGKWKASIKAYPHGFPIDLLHLQPGEESVKQRDFGEMLGNWLDRECPEHPVLSRSRPAKE